MCITKRIAPPFLLLVLFIATMSCATMAVSQVGSPSEKAERREAAGERGMSFMGFTTGQARSAAEANAKRIGFILFRCHPVRVGMVGCEASMSRSTGQNREGVVGLSFVNGRLGVMSYLFEHEEYAEIVAQMRKEHGATISSHTVRGFSQDLWGHNQAQILLMEADPPDWKGDIGALLLGGHRKTGHTWSLQNRP